MIHSLKSNQLKKQKAVIPCNSFEDITKGNYIKLGKIIKSWKVHENNVIKMEIEYLEDLLLKIDYALSWTFPKEEEMILSNICGDCSDDDSVSYYTCREEFESECDYATSTSKESSNSTNEISSDSSFNSSKNTKKRKLMNSLRICVTGLSSSQLNLIEASQSKLDFVLVKSMDPTVTHLITATNKDKAASRTVKYILGILYHCWIIDYQWLVDSLSNKMWVDEEEYEIQMDQYGFKNGPSKSRTKRNKLFEGFSFYLASPFKEAPNKKEMKLFIMAAGGKVVSTIDKTCIILVHENEEISLNVEWTGKYRSLISHQWIIDSISGYEIRPQSMYIIKRRNI